MGVTERSIERTVHIAAGRKQVFRALLDPGMLSRWLFATVNLTPERGAGYSFEWRDSAVPATAQGEILELVPDQRLVLSWSMEADGVTSTARFDLADAPDGGTILNFVHAGLPPEPEWLPRVRQVGLEWDKVLLNLSFLLEEQGEGKHLFYFRTTLTVAAPMQRLFRAWTTPGGLGAWMARDLFVAAEEGQGITGVTLDTGRPLEVRLHRLEPDRHLRMTWSEGGLRGLLGVSFWPGQEGVVMTLTLRSFALMEGERPIIQALWNKRFERLAQYLERRPLGKKPAHRGSFTITKEIESTPLRAWNALTEASILRRWFVGWTDFEPRAGAEYTILWNSYGELRGRILEVHSGEAIRFTWDIDEMEETSEVLIKVRPNPQQPGLCTVELTHSGWGDGPKWDEHRRAHEVGWTSVLALLDFYLRRGGGKEPREFSLRRRIPRPLEKTASLLTTEAGLTSWLASRASVEMTVGGRYQFDLGGRTEYSGTVVARDPAGENAVELNTPEPAFLDWWVAPDPDPEVSRLFFSFTTYVASTRWFEARRAEWTEAMNQLAAGA